MIKNNKNFNTCLKAGGVLFCVFVAALFAVFGASVANAQTAMVTEVSVRYLPDTSTTNGYFCQTSPSALDVSFLPGASANTFDNIYNTNSLDPWRSSALIEYDQSFLQNNKKLYPNDCLSLCATVTCANPARKTEGSTGSSSNTINTYYDVASSDFPIQSVLFEIFKYQPNSNPYNADTTPPIRTIALTPAGSTGANTCYGVGVYVENPSSNNMKTHPCCDYCNGSGGLSNCTGDCATACAETCEHFTGSNYKAKCEAGTTTLDFCAAWDGSYEIDGEFGKSNGQFGFRANIQTKWPGDGVSSGDVEVNHTMAYPGSLPNSNISQIPIQVDVTNVHSVRSSSTMVGTTTKVPVQPYDLTYKLSKDALTTITISDPGEKCDCNEVMSGGSFIYALIPSNLAACSHDETIREPFNLINKQPRLGEGIPNGTNVNVDSWDGRDDSGIFMPYGNYLVGITATTHDEWSGENEEDLSRTVTRQLSLDPLKITDIQETGLAKLSTSYAKIDYVLTEAATVHVMIFTPGTYIGSNVEIPSLDDAYTTILGSISNGRLVDYVVEQKQGRANVNTKWDGICRNSNADGNGCNFGNGTYKFGTPMPDGDYVYVMWAEIPYTTSGLIPAATCVNGKWWSGVKTRKYHNGILPINRGLPEITVGAVGYTSLGSSPTAFGLDPFTFNYAVSRDSIVDATIKTTAPDISSTDQVYTVKHLLTNEVAVAAKENKFTWDGIDDDGYQVAPGTYMVEFVAKDSLYPEKQATMTVQFPVDLFRVVDVNTTPILDEATSQASISYTLSKSMDVTVEIYPPDVVIPTQDSTTWCRYEYSTTTAATVLTHDDFTTEDPIKSFILPKAGEGMTITEIWDGLDHSVPGTSAVAPLPDGNYPYRICTRTTQDIAHYYDLSSGVPVAQEAVNGRDGASDRPTGFITIARGSIAFNKITITPSQPAMKYSTETIYLPAYEIGMSTSRAAKVNIEVISTADDQCLLDPNNTVPAGTVCRTLSTYAYGGVDGYFDPTKIYKVYWDGKDSKGEYVKYGSYEIKLTGLPYPLPAGTQPKETIFSQVISVNNFQVYDRYVEDITRENPTGKFAYQISVPMKVAIQIFKPGTMSDRTTIGGNAIGLIDPITGDNVTDINDVLVKAIVGIRPNLVSLDEVWDGTDYAGQEVPDGIYPYRYVTALNAYDMDSVTGAVNNVTDLDQAGAKVADWEKYITLEHINVARGDSWYADVDWKSKKVTSFFPNPLKGNEGWFEITKLPAPGKISIKIYNIAGDLVRSGGYDCINAKMETATLEQINNGFFGNDMGLQPYMNLTPPGTTPTNGVSRNFTLRCKWDKTNDHGKQVARGLYYAIMELDPTRGNAKKSQRVIKILIP